jgi:hypothetical protein
LRVYHVSKEAFVWLSCKAPQAWGQAKSSSIVIIVMRRNFTALSKALHAPSSKPLHESKGMHILKQTHPVRLLVLLCLFFIPSRMYVIAARHGAQEEPFSGNNADNLAGTEK